MCSAQCEQWDEQLLEEIEHRAKDERLRMIGTTEGVVKQCRDVN